MTAIAGGRLHGRRGRRTRWPAARARSPAAPISWSERARARRRCPSSWSRSIGSRSCATSQQHGRRAAHRRARDARRASRPIRRFARRLTALADAAAIVGSHATRAFGTIGGNLMNASPAMETGGPLLCFDATVTLRSTSGTRTAGRRRAARRPGADDGGARRAARGGARCRSRAEGTGSCYVRLEYRRQMEIAVVGRDGGARV